MIDKKLFMSSRGDAKVAEDGTHVEAKGFVVAIEWYPSGWLASNAAWANPGQ